MRAADNIYVALHTVASAVKKKVKAAKDGAYIRCQFHITCFSWDSSCTNSKSPPLKDTNELLQARELSEDKSLQKIRG